MAQIKEYQQRTRAEVPGRLPAGAQVPPGTRFGVDLTPLARSLDNLSDTLHQNEEEQGRAWSANAVADARLHWTTQLDARKETAAPGAPDFTKSLVTDFDEYAAKSIENAPTPSAKRFMADRLAALRADLGSHASHYEAGARIDWRDDQLRQGSDKAAKTMNRSPEQYQVVLAEQLAIIDSSAMPQMKKSARREATIAQISNAAVWSQIQRSPSDFLRSIGFYNTPVIQNPDGTVSTERTITVEMDGKHHVIPTIVGGKQLSADDAVNAFRQGSNFAVGTFNDAASADKFAKERSAAGGALSGRTRRTSGDLTDITGNTAFDALPHERRVQMLESALTLKSQMDVDGDKAARELRKKQADEAMKEAWARLYGQSKAGPLTNEYIASIRPMLNDNEYKSLLEAKRRGPEASQRSDPATFRELQGLIYDNPRQAEIFAHTAHRNGRLSNDDFSSALQRARTIGRSEGPKSEYERTRQLITRHMEPSPMVNDPVQKSRYGEALDTYDRWYLAGPNGQRSDREVQERGREIIDQYKLIDFSETVIALPSPRGTRIRRNPNDIQGMENDIALALTSLKKQRAEGRLTALEYDMEVETVNRWIRAIKTQKGAK